MLEYKGKKTSTAKVLLIYSALFLVITLGVYYVFLNSGRTFLRYDFTNRDTVSQRYMFIFEFKRFLANLLGNTEYNTWDWSIGLGSDGYAFNSSNIVNPFAYITYFAPERYVDLAYTLSIVLRVYFSGFTYVLFARKIGHDELQTIVGALSYAFCPWIIVTSTIQGSFLMATILLPLVLLGVEKILQKESPLLFILSVGYTVLVTFSFAYMIAIIIIMYWFVKYLTDYREGGIGGFFKSLGGFIACGICGIMISGVGLMVTLARYTGSTATTGVETPVHFTRVQYLRLPLNLFDWTTFFGSSSIIGVTSICIVLIPIIIIRFFKRKPNAIMTGILAFLILIPYASSMFNFFSYPSGRWMFAFILFFALAASECLDPDVLSGNWAKISILGFFAIDLAYLAWMIKILNKTRKFVVAVNVGTAIVFIILLFIMYRGKKAASADTSDKAVPAANTDTAGLAAAAEGPAIKGETQITAPAEPAITAPAPQPVFARPGKLISFVMILVLAFNIVANYHKLNGKIYKGYLKHGEIDEMLGSSPQRVGPEIVDNDFYRIDQVDEITGVRTPHCRVNEAIYYGNRSNYGFYSSVDSEWLEFNKLLGNNQGYYKRVAPCSNDNRFGLDLLQSTKYFLGDSDGYEGASAYAGYGFEPYKTIDGVDVLKNKYFIGLGCVFSNYMRESEWLKLSYAERELALLNAVVLADDTAAPKGMTELKANSMDFGVTEIPYEVKKQTEDKIRISAENDDNHQVLLSFKNISAEKTKGFTVRFDNGVVQKAVRNTIDNERGFSDIEDLTVNLGTGAEACNKVKIEISRQDVSFDDLVLYSIPVSAYDKAGAALSETGFVTEKFDNDYIKGRIDSDKGGILYLSIFDDSGWDVYVDGKKADQISGVDIAFTGIPVDAGRHTIELTYHTKGLVSGAVISLVGLLLAFIISARHKKRS